MEDGEISISPYDTAWVAMVENVNGSGEPQFPTSLEWIAKNQLPDGSWGDGDIFLAHDRIINTLACVVALKSWNIHPDKTDKGTLLLHYIYILNYCFLINNICAAYIYICMYRFILYQRQYLQAWR